MQCEFQNTSAILHYIMFALTPYFLTQPFRKYVLLFCTHHRVLRHWSKIDDFSGQH